jgi:hypothetical protein
MCTIDHDQHALAWSAREEFSREKRVLHLATVSKKGAVQERRIESISTGTHVMRELRESYYLALLFTANALLLILG